MGVSATVSVSTYAKHSVSCPTCHFRCFKAQYRHLQKQEEKRKSVFSAICGSIKCCQGCALMRWLLLPRVASSNPSEY